MKPEYPEEFKPVLRQATSGSLGGSLTLENGKIIPNFGLYFVAWSCCYLYGNAQDSLDRLRRAFNVFKAQEQAERDKTAEWDNAPKTNQDVPTELKPHYYEVDTATADNSPCQACGSTMYWVINPKTGNKVPVDADGQSHYRTCNDPKRFSKKKPSNKKTKTTKSQEDPSVNTLFGASH